MTTKSVCPCTSCSPTIVHQDTTRMRTNYETATNHQKQYRSKSKPSTCAMAGGIKLLICSCSLTHMTVLVFMINPQAVQSSDAATYAVPLPPPHLDFAPLVISPPSAHQPDSVTNTPLPQSIRHAGVHGSNLQASRLCCHQLSTATSSCCLWQSRGHDAAGDEEGPKPGSQVCLNNV